MLTAPLVFYFLVAAEANAAAAIFEKLKYVL